MPVVVPLIAAAGGAVVSNLMNRSATNAANRANQTAADSAAKQAQIAADQYNDWKSDFLPLQHDLVADAKKAGSAYEYDRAAELANGDVTQAYGRAKADLSSRLASFGVDPSSGKYAATLGKLGLAEAAAGAGAMNKARDAVTDKAWAKKIDVYSAGKGIPGQAMAGLSSAAQTNAMVAGNYQNQASRNAAGIGSFVQQVTPGLQKWWNTPSPAPGGSTADNNPNWSPGD